MSRTVKLLSTAATVFSLALALVACTATPPTESEPEISQEEAEYNGAVENYASPLPDGYTFPADLDGADSADKWWWCSVMDAAFTAYFDDNDEATALEYLAEAETVDPGEYVGYEGPGRTYIDREVRYIDGGVDSQYLEYNAQACRRWASDLGHNLTP